MPGGAGGGDKGGGGGAAPHPPQPFPSPTASLRGHRHPGPTYSPHSVIYGAELWGRAMAAQIPSRGWDVGGLWGPDVGVCGQCPVAVGR